MQQSRQTYLIDTRHGKKLTDSFVVGSKMGWFCTSCPTVVINPEEVADLLQHGLPHWDMGTRFAVLGIVDLDAIPQEKSHLPLGDDDNPIPLVRFASVRDETASGQSLRPRRATGRRRAASVRSRGRRRSHRRR